MLLPTKETPSVYILPSKDILEWATLIQEIEKTAGYRMVTMTNDDIIFG